MSSDTTTGRDLVVGSHGGGVDPTADGGDEDVEGWWGGHGRRAWLMMPASMVCSTSASSGSYCADDLEHVEIIHENENERGDLLPGLRMHEEIADIAQGIGFELLEERDLAWLPVGSWWARLMMGHSAC